MQLARSTNALAAMDHRPHSGIRACGMDAFWLEVVQVLETRPEMTRAAILADLATLEALCREKEDPALLY